MKTLKMLLVAMLLASSSTLVQGQAPYWDDGSGASYQPVDWPTAPSDPAQCGDTCGDWLPYTRFGSSINDPRTQDPSNGGTSPQNYVNIASSCTDTGKPSVYYALHRGSASDGSEDVILFRWRVEQIANTYATGPKAGAFGSSHPWNSALWTVLFDIDGDGYRDLAAHLDGSSGSPSNPIDVLAGIWGQIPTQSIDYADANINLLGVQSTGFIDRDTDEVLNFQNTLTPVASWPNGSSETVWDYGSTRAVKVSSRPCNEYFIDYQIPVALLDATSVGGPKVERSTPISMLFCTANSLNNPFQKDCALNRPWVAEPTSPAPFGDYVSFELDKPYQQPIIKSLTVEAPQSCSADTRLVANIQDSLFLNNSGQSETSVKAASFWYYYDANGNGAADDTGSTWLLATAAATVSGALGQWEGNWDTTTLPKGRFLVGVQAVDDRTKVDDGATPVARDHRTFSYVTSNAQGELYLDGNWVELDGNSLQNSFPTHGPSQLTPSSTEDWYGNPAITGATVATVGVDVALNNCGVAPSIVKSATPDQVAPGDTVTFEITISNPSANPDPITVSQFEDALPDGFSYVTSSSSIDGSSFSDPTIVGQTLTWALSSDISVAAGGSVVLSFDATASSTTGTYNNVAEASTSFGDISSAPASVIVDAPRVVLTKTPNQYLIAPDGTSILTYSIAYENGSSLTLNNAVITDDIASNTAYSACTGGTSCTNSSGTVTWSLGTLAPGASGEVTLSIAIEPTFTDTSLPNTATLTAEQPGDTAGSPTFSETATTTVSVATPAGVLSIEKTANLKRVEPGSNVIYTINYENYGLGTATAAEIIDTLPEGMTFVACDLSGSTHFDRCVNSSGTVTIDSAGGDVNIPAGATGTVTIEVQAAAAPFTFPNPTVNTAGVTWASSSASDSISVGISNTDFCEGVFYFRKSGANNIASPTAPTGTADYYIAGDSVTDVSLVFTGTSPAETLDISGSNLTISFYLSGETGALGFDVKLEDMTDSNSPVLLVSGTGSPGNTGLESPTFANVSTTVGSGKVLAPNTPLRWTFVISDNSKKERRFWMDTVQHPSRSSFCFAESISPPALTINKIVDKLQINGGTSELLTYTIDYANVGGSTVTGAAVTDTLPAGATNCEASTDNSSWTACSSSSGNLFSIGSIAPGASGTVYVRALSPSAATQGDTLTGTAVLGSNETADIQAQATTTVGVPGGVSGSGTPALSVSKRADKANVGSGETVTYSLTVVNTGEGPASNITVEDTVPATAYYQLVSNSLTGGGSASGNNLSWTIASLAIGEAKTLTYQMQTTASGLPAGIIDRSNTANLSDSAYCTGTPKPPSCTSNTVIVRINGNPSLTLSKVASATTGLKPNDNVTWTLTLSNNGSATAVNPRIVDPLPDKVNFVSATNSGTLDVLNNQVVWDLSDLPAGASTTVGLTTKVKNLGAGPNQSIINQATATAANAGSVTADTQSTASATPILSLTKTGPESIAFPVARVTESTTSATELRVDSGRLIDAGQWIRVGTSDAKVIKRRGSLLTLDTPVTASAGDGVSPGVTWSLAWENSGDASATAVTLTDTLPSGWILAEASTGPDGTAAQTTTSGDTAEASWTLPSIEAGARGSVTVTAIPIAAGDTVNTAALSDALYCTGATPPASCSATATARIGGIKISKSTSTPVVWAGETASYSILVENTLNVALTDIVVTGELTEGFTYIPNTSTIDGVAVEPTIVDGQPVWSGLDLNPNGELVIDLNVTVSSDTAPGTYDSDATTTFVPGSSTASLATTQSSQELAGRSTSGENNKPRSTPLNSAGIVPFDPLSTTQEDVTVLTTQTFLVDGRVFEDANANGSFDEGEIGFEGVRLEIDDDSGLPYEVFTNEFGQFQQIVETAGDWVITQTGGDNATILNNYQLLGLYNEPKTVSLTTEEAAASVLLGYFSTNQEEPTYTLSYDANTGSGTPPSLVTGLTGGQTVTVASPANLTKTAFVFTAWNTVSDGSGTSVLSGGSFSMPASDTTLFAQWTSIPVAVDDTYATTPSTAVSGTVSTNDTAPAGSTFSIVTGVSSGTLDTTSFSTAGEFTYTPASSLTNGTDQFVYSVCLPAPNTSTCDEATATITVSSSNTPVAPQAVDDAYQTTSGTAVSGTVSTNDTAPTGSTFSIVTSVSEGTLDTTNFGATGEFSYTPASTLTNGTDQFVYRVCLPTPNTSTCDQATATITVVTAPKAVDDAYTATPGQAVTGTVGTNDTVPSGSTFSIVTSVVEGTLDTTNFATAGEFRYTPAKTLANGTDQFVYQVCLPAPNTSTCDQATATITVGAPLPIPTNHWLMLLMLLLTTYGVGLLRSAKF